MKRLVGFLFVLIMLSGLFLGCARNLKNSYIKCPKCGAFFSTQEGAEEFERMRGR
jgi:hypothetical protein